MEKVIVALWGGDHDRLRADLPEALRKAGASQIRLNLHDAEVASAAALIQSWQNPQQDAVVQFLLPSANARFRSDIDAVLAHFATRFEAWLVAESVIIANTDHPPEPGQRTWGWSQASFISFRPDLSREDAIGIWHDHHTHVAI